MIQIYSLTDGILQLLLEKGVGLSARGAEVLQNNLQDKLTAEISALLEKLTNVDLQVNEQTGGGPRIASQHVVRNLN